MLTLDFCIYILLWINEFKNPHRSTDPMLRSISIDVLHVNEKIPTALSEETR